MVAEIRSFWLAIGLLAAVFALPATAQENLDRGKNGAQLFASDCAICHKSPVGLAKGGGIFGVSSFLRDHFTVSRESASLIAAYLEAVDRATPAAAAKRPPVKRTAKPADAKPSDAKPSDAKPPEAKPVEAKPADAKPADAKAGEASAPAPAPKPE